MVLTALEDSNLTHLQSGPAASAIYADSQSQLDYHLSDGRAAVYTVVPEEKKR